jgi:type I restriction-modification system DNA methylase subunit
MDPAAAGNQCPIDIRAMQNAHGRRSGFIKGIAGVGWITHTHGEAIFSSSVGILSDNLDCLDCTRQARDNSRPHFRGPTLRRRDCRMQDQRNYLRQAVNAAAPRPHRYVAIRDLAESLGWHPNYTIDDVTEHNEHCHLVVEHGLENAAVLTFLPLPYRPSDLSRSDLSRVLSISYNNLVDAHIILSDDQVLFANNRFDPPRQQIDILRADDLSFLSGFRAFKFLRPDRRPDFQNCEDELIGVVSQWRRILTGETGLDADLRALSVLFNAIFFIRACEDYFSATTGETPPSLIERIGYRTTGPGDLPKILRDAFDDYRLENGKNGIIDFGRMQIFRDVSVSLCRDFIKDFYRSKNGPYPFNFALMSKHALSRIYERYVTEMRYTEETERQYSFLPSLPEEQFLSQEGVVYTPQFVASFFARYLIDEIPPRVLRAMHAIDPACGSGIFLRTLLEAQTVSLPQRNSEHIKSLFSSVSGIDIDENAVEATRLSLSLLHLILTGKMPTRLNLMFDNAIDVASGAQSRRKVKKDLFIGNPPFIKLDKLPENVRTKYKEFLGEDFVGRADSYIAFLKLAVDNVRPGGFICFVLPHNFLITKNAEFLRRKISDDFHIHCLIDLSNVEVFKGVGAYVVLLIIQKKSPENKYGPKARVARIKTRVGEALQYCLDGTDIENEWYTCFHLPQEFWQCSP